MTFLQKHHGQMSDSMLTAFFIIQLFQVIREPIIIDRKQTEERGLSSSLTAHKTEHNLKFAPRLKSS